MIDLISHGLSLRKQITISTEDPQEIRSISANVTPYLVRDSAGPAEFATRDNTNQSNDYCGNSKLAPGAESADLAESQFQQWNFLADDLRNNCGLITSQSKEVAVEQENKQIKTLCECGYRSPFCSCGFYKFLG